MSAPLGEILLLGVWINSLGWVPAVMLQGQGRPAVVAKLHALELLPYVAILWVAVSLGGLPGAAWAWVLRAVVDVVLLLWATSLWERVRAVLWTGAALIVAAQLTVAFTGTMPVIRTIAATAIVLAAVFYSLQVAPPGLRQMLARIPPFASLRPAALRK